MRKDDIVDYIINTTTLSRSQAIAATDSVVKAVTTAPKKARNISKGIVVTIPARRTAKIILGRETQKSNEQITRKDEIRYTTSDPKKMLGRFLSCNVVKKWIEDFVDKSGQVQSVERNGLTSKHRRSSCIHTLPLVPIC